MTSQDDKKRIAAEKALSFVPLNEIIGVGTGSTVNFFIEALASIKHDIKGAVSSSQASTELLKKIGIPIYELNDVHRLPIYVDGADEVNHSLHMIKGGGGAHFSEKLLAENADVFVCIADESKYVSALGKFPIAVEVIPQARSYVARELVKMGGQPELRMGFVTDAGNQILDVRGLDFTHLRALEDKINQITGVVENGLFANRPADILILAHKDRAEVIQVAQIR